MTRMRHGWRVLVAALAALLVGAPAASACSTDDTAWFEGFLDSSCLGALNSTELDTLGGLRLQTTGATATTTWTTDDDFTTGVSYQAKIFGPIGFSTLFAKPDPANTLELPAAGLALTRDTASTSILGPSASDNPDNDSVDDPTVIKAGSTYVMYYSGLAEDGSGPAIFRATSADGRSWTKRDANTGDPDLDPVLTGSTGAFDARGVHGADVLYDASDSTAPYKMYYSGRGDVFGRIGFATSTDGITWVKYDDSDADTDPDFVLDHGKAGARDSFAAAHPSILRDGSTWKMWYEGSDSNQKSINYATSSDGLVWSKGGAVIEPGSGNIEFGAFAPTVWKTATTEYHMLFGVQKETGTGTGVFQTKIQEASSSDGIAWTPGAIAMNPATSRFDAFDLNSPDVLEDPGAGSSAFKLYYSGSRVDNGGKHVRIGLSQTANGSGWQGGKYNTPDSSDFDEVLGISPLTAAEPFDARHASGVAASPVTGGGFVGAYWGTRGFDFLPRLGLVTSPDGGTWTKVTGTQPGASLLPLGSANQFDQHGQRDPSLLYAVNGDTGATKDYHLYFTGLEDGVASIGYSGAAETGSFLPDNTTWSNPGLNALFTGGAGTFDDGGVSDPYVVKDGANYVMYYTGTSGAVSKIGRAVSTTGADGTFTAATTAVLDVGAAGSFDAASAEDPVVVADPVTANMWHMTYTAVESVDGRQVRRTAYATSTDDGVTWVKSGVVLNPSQAPFAFDESGAQPQGAYVDTATTPDTIHLWYDGLDRDGRARGGHASAPLGSAGVLHNGWATYQLGDTTTTARDWRAIAAATTGTGSKQLWMSFLQPYSTTGKEYWSGFFPVQGIDSPAALSFLLTVKGVRWQARLADPSGTPAIDRVDLDHAPIAFAPSGDGITQEVRPPTGQTITSWRTLTVTADLFQPLGSGSGDGTILVRDAADTTTLASASLNTGGEREIDLSGIPAASNQSLKLKFLLSSASPFTASPVVRQAKVLYFTNVSQPSITLSASPTEVTSGGAVTLSGTVMRGTTPLAGETVTITPGGTTTTDASGNYALVVNPTMTTSYTASAAGVTSAPVTVTVTAPPPLDVTLAANPPLVIFGQSTALSGKVTQAGAPVPNQAVSLFEQPFGTPAFAAITGATTSATGDYSSAVTPQRNTTYRATVPTGSSEPTVAVQVAQKMTFRASRRGTRGSFSGTIQPTHPNREVVIQRKSGTGYANFKRVRTTSTSSFATTAKLKACQKYTFRVITAADDDHAAGQSADVLVERHRVSLKVSVRGRKVTFTGKVSPVHKSGSVVIRRIVGTRAAKFATAKLTRKSTFKLVKSVKKGRYVFRADKAADRCHFAGSSARRSARVR